MVSFEEHMKYLEHVEYDLDFRDLYNFHNNIWTTKDHADFIPLTEMGNTHIENCINLITKDTPICAYGLGPLWLPKLINELKRRRVVE